MRRNNARNYLIEAIIRNQVCNVNNYYQAVLQGVPFTGVQILRLERLILLHEKGPREQNCAPLCAAS